MKYIYETLQGRCHQIWSGPVKTGSTVPVVPTCLNIHFVITQFKCQPLILKVLVSSPLCVEFQMIQMTAAVFAKKSSTKFDLSIRLAYFYNGRRYISYRIINIITFKFIAEVLSDILENDSNFEITRKIFI